MITFTGSSDYGQDIDKTKVEMDDATSEDGGGLIIEEGGSSRSGLDMEDKEYMGETLDLSKRKEEDEYQGRPPGHLVQTSRGGIGSIQGNLVQTTGAMPGGHMVQTSAMPAHLAQTSLPLIASHITSSRVLEGQYIIHT